MSSSIKMLKNKSTAIIQADQSCTELATALPLLCATPVAIYSKLFVCTKGLGVPVLDLMVSCPAVFPTRSYWLRRELSSSTTTEDEAL